MSTEDSKGVEKRRVWVDGKLVPWGEATIHVLSQSVARGSLVFDVMPCYERAEGPVVFGMREHSERFIRSAALSGMTLRLDLEDLLSAISETVRANPGTQLVKINAYHPGISLDVLPVDAEASVAITAFALADLIPGLEKVGDMPPARLQVTEVRKMPPWVISPQAKLAAGYLYTAVAKQIARKDGFDDVLLLDEHGDVAESSTQSFFLVDGGTLYTASVDYVLGGITRRAVLELAQDEGIPIVEGHVAAERLSSADEAFMAGTTTNIWPVSQISSRDLPAPVPGAITDTIRERINRVIAGEDGRFSPRWMQEV
jgi:branched-chain amino acid aminotransferase